MSPTAADGVMQALADALAAGLPHRLVTRSLRDTGEFTAEQLGAGVLCLVCEGGGEFANYRGREADLGSIQARVVGYVQVPERAEPLDTERAELALLGDVLGWINTLQAQAGQELGFDWLEPGEWHSSRQMEHPLGWMTLALKVK